MNKVIKEILDFKENADYKKLSVDEIVILKNYITNLQEENNDLKEQVDYQNIWREEYSNRIDKAIEYIIENDDFYYGDELYDSYQEIINIFKGEEMIEDIPKEEKIPKKLTTWYSIEVEQSDEENVEYANCNFETMYEKINEICDYLKSKGD